MDKTGGWKDMTAPGSSRRAGLGGAAGPQLMEQADARSDRPGVCTVLGEPFAVEPESQGLAVHHEFQSARNIKRELAPRLIFGKGDPARLRSHRDKAAALPGLGSSSVRGGGLTPHRVRLQERQVELSIACSCAMWADAACPSVSPRVTGKLSRNSKCFVGSW